jgi:hypothetical protein
MLVEILKPKMRKIRKIFLGLVLGLLTQQIARSQGAITYLSNLSGSSVTNISNARSGLITGNNPDGYILNAVQLAMNNPIGTPNSFTVTIYEVTNSLGGDQPGEEYIGTLNGPAPLTAGVYTYVPASQLILLPDAGYQLVESGSGNGSFEWSVTIGSKYFTSLGGWSFGDVLSGPQFAMIATPIPEPKFCYLFTLVGLGIFFRRQIVRIDNSSESNCV